MNSDIATGGVKWCGQLGRSFLQSFINLNMYLSYESNIPPPTCLAKKGRRKHFYSKTVYRIDPNLETIQFSSNRITDERILCIHLMQHYSAIKTMNYKFMQ